MAVTTPIDRAPASADSPSDIERELGFSKTEPVSIADPVPTETLTAPSVDKPLNWLQRRKEERAKAQRLEGSFASYPHLLALKPKEKFVFRSDYYEVDGSVACVLSYFHNSAAEDGFGPFWGIGRIPDGLDASVTAIVLEQVARKSASWVEQHSNTSERLDGLEQGEQEQSSSLRSKGKAEKSSNDLVQTFADIQNGAAYLMVENRLLLKAPTLEILDESVQRLARLYIDRFATLSVAPYMGEQRRELAGLLRPNARKRGPGFGFSSTEFAGSYSLVTNGLNDPSGEFVGHMVGDVNNSAVLFDVNDYRRHVVIADGAMSDYLDRAHVSDMWASKLSQACLLQNGSVVHLVLDGANLDVLGPRFDGLSSRVDLNSGDVNMFEMFGEESDELTIFAAQMQKLGLMFEQLYETNDGAMGSIIRSQLEKTATQFYVDQRMWRHNAKAEKSKLRVVNLPHVQVPRLQMFVSYLDTAHKAILHAEKHDPDELRAYNVLRGIAKNLLDTNGDLFNNHTVAAVDGIRDARRVVYDFSKLMRRGRGVAMAQLVNIVGFAIGKLQQGDTVVIHGAEYIDERVKGYIVTQFDELYRRGGRVVFSYNDVDKMLADADFNKFDSADYTVLGAMRDKSVAEYQKLLHQQIPIGLTNLITRRDENLSYLRRGVTNVVFELDLSLGINPLRERERRALQREAAQAAKDQQLEAVMTQKLVPGANLTSSSGSNVDRLAAQTLGTKPVRPRRAAKGQKALSQSEPGRKTTMTKQQQNRSK